MKTASLSPLLESDWQETADNSELGQILAVVVRMIPTAAAQHAVHFTTTVNASLFDQDRPGGKKRLFATLTSRADRHRLVGGPAALDS